MNDFFQRLKQRKLVQWAVAYVAAAFALLQGIDIVAQQFGWPDGVRRGITLAMVVGFFVTLVLAWYHGERGAQRVSGTELLILAVLLSLGGGLLWHFAAASRSAPAALAETPVASPPVAIPSKSIAVLPFQNLSSDKDNAYFASGIQDMILTKLAGVGDLKVISRTSTEKYASHPDNLKEIARQLGVAKILEGTVQKAGNSVLINVQMIDAGTDTHLWAQAYTRTLENIFGVEGEVAENVAESLHAALTGDERAALARKPTENAAALQAYLKGLALSTGYSFTGGASDQIAALFREAVTLDPRFTLAWSELASQELNIYWFGFDATPQRLATAKAALDEAEALAPDLPQVEVTRAEYVYRGLYDFTGALAIMRKVQPKLPNDARVWYMTALLERRIGEWDNSTADFERARALDPNNVLMKSDADASLVAQHRYPEALAGLDADLGSQTNLSWLEYKQIVLWNLGGLDVADRMLAPLPPDKVEVHRAWQALYHRDYRKAADLFAHAIAQAKDAHSELVFDSYLPAGVGWRLLQALSETRAGATATAQELYRQAEEMARAGLAAQSGSRNVDAAWHSALGIALAGLGERDAAVAEGKAAVALIPESSDAFEGPNWEDELARIYAMNGDAEHAPPLIEHLVHTDGSFITPALLKLDPVWDPLRQDRRFQALLKNDASTADATASAGAQSSPTR